MTGGKRIAAAVMALCLCVGLTGCGNKIDYKAVKTEITTTTGPDGQVGTVTTTDGQTTTAPAVTTEPVVSEKDVDYFKKCAFVGEALCSGMVYVDDIKESQLYTNNSAHVYDIGNSEWTVNGKKLALPQALTEAKSKYIYVWVGPNDLSDLDPEKFVEYYSELIAKITTANPKSYVGIITIAPTSASYEGTLGDHKIEEYNQKLAEMVDSMTNKRLHLFNITMVVGDETGHLKSDYDTGDGLHMSADAYIAIGKYLYENQISPFVSDYIVSDTTTAQTTAPVTTAPQMVTTTTPAR